MFSYLPMALPVMGWFIEMKNFAQDKDGVGKR
jgi:hypothetical protein